MKWILERLKEPSTYKGISLALGALGLMIAPDLLMEIGTSLGVIYGAIELIRKEAR